MTRGAACLCALSAAAAIGALPSTAAPVPGSAASALQSAGTVRILPSAPVQGDTLVVLVSGSPRTGAAVTFDGNPVATYSTPGGDLRALVGTDPDIAAGIHAVGVAIRGAGGTVRRVTQRVHLAAGRFGVRHLTLAPTTFGLITPENLAIESRTLVPVLNRRTPTAWWDGAFAVPSDGPIDSPYGEQGVYNGHREWWHMGVDFAALEGAPITAANGGVVALARSLPLGGNTIVVDHGQGVLSEYLHLSAFVVREGARVERGTVIGRIGATGLVTGPSVHWGLYVNGLPVNPLFWTAPRAGLTAP
ncbi:MAG TPA: M23 family metallopeptidase [bacterium]|nr:M23 family metallopeptidase [bacterium]